MQSLTNKNPLILVTTPLATLGVFLEIVKQRFTVTDDTQRWLYVPDRPNESNIDIRIGWNKDVEERDKRPTLSIYRGDFHTPKQVVNNLMTKNMRYAAKGFGSMSDMQIFVGCLSTLEGEAEVLGDIVHAWILANREIIEKYFNFHEISNPVLLAPRPYERDKSLTEVPVTFTVMNMIRWATQPIPVILEEIIINLTGGMTSVEMINDSSQQIFIGNEIFQKIAINSMNKD